MKTIQKITAWRFPCDGNTLEFEPDGALIVQDLMPFKTKAALLEQSFNKDEKNYCNCDKKCKAEKITITVTRSE